MNAPRAATLLILLSLAACGGGGGMTSSNTNSTSGAHDFSAGGSNVVLLTVGNGPGSVAQPTFNIPYVSVTVCAPSGGQCATINNVLVDTGSTGFRIIKSQLPGDVNLTPLADPNPNNPGNTMAECLPFADGSAWGSVALATVRIGGETAGSIPIQIIDDSPPATVCSNGANLGSVDAFDANGVLGIGVATVDCGSVCGNPNNGVYYSCSPGGNCTPAALPVAEQVSNPVRSFAKDNNGVILQLPALSGSGAVGANGYLVFGIDTESNNALAGANIYAVDGTGDFNTTFGSSLLTGFIDSGSNAMFFPDKSLPLCQQSSSFYCPPSTASLSATNSGYNGTTNQVAFQVADLEKISGNDFAINDAAGPTSSVSSIGKNYFDWGLPFFYGNTVFVAIEDNVAAGTAGPYFAY